MSFPLVMVCARRTELPIEQQHQPKLLKCEQKTALITDIVLAALAITVATLIVLANNGVNLGHLSSIGSLGNTAAYVLFSVGGALIAVDILQVMILMARHINRLFAINSKLANTSQHQALNTQIRNLQTEIDSVKADSIKAKRQWEEIGLKNTKALATAQEISEEQIAEIEKLKTLINEKGGGNDLLNGRISQLEFDKTQLQAKLKIDAEITDCENQLSIKKIELQSIASQIEPTERELANLKKELLIAQQKLTGSKEDQETEINNLKNLKEQIETDQARLNSLQQNVHQLELEIQSKIKDAEANMQANADALKLEQVKLADAQKELQDLEAQKNLCLSEIESCNTKLANLKVEEQKIIEKIKNKEIDIEQQEKDAIKRSNEQLENMKALAEKEAQDIKLRANEEANELKQGAEEAARMLKQLANDEYNVAQDKIKDLHDRHIIKEEADKIILGAQQKANTLIETANQSESRVATLQKQIDELEEKIKDLIATKTLLDRQIDQKKEQADANALVALEPNLVDVESPKTSLRQRLPSSYQFLEDKFLKIETASVPKLTHYQTKEILSSEQKNPQIKATIERAVAFFQGSLEAEIKDIEQVSTEFAHKLDQDLFNANFGKENGDRVFNANIEENQRASLPTDLSDYFKSLLDYVSEGVDPTKQNQRIRSCLYVLAEDVIKIFDQIQVVEV